MKQNFYFLAFLLLLAPTAALVAQPANDNCANAISLGRLPAPAACGTTVTGTKKGAVDSIVGTNVNATAENPYPYNAACPPNLSSPPKDVWYSFVASSYQAYITITNATFLNPIITIWEGSCSNPLSIGCATGAGYGDTLTLFNLTSGQTYYIQVSGLDSTQTGTFTLKCTSETDCANCLVGSTVTVTPPPVNGTFAAGETVTFCDSIFGWNETSSNWLHGVVPTFGSGWNLSTLVPGAGPAPCTAGGVWSWYPHGDTSSHNHSIWPAGFYYETASGNANGVINHSPGDNYGDNDIGNCSWKFCVTITTNSSANCSPGSNLDVTFAASGDGQSGSWTSRACTNDPVADIYIVGACCPPTMSSTPATCGNPNGGTATATPVGTNSPWSFHWSNGTTQTGLTGASTITGLAVGIDTVTVTDASSCTSTAVVNVTSTSAINGGPDQYVTCFPLNSSATMAATGTGTWTAVGTNPGTATITTPGSPTTTITAFSTSGIYNFVWANGACTDTVSVTVSTNPNAGPDQTISCASLPGGTATMAALGSGTWTAQSNNPGTAIITTPTSPTTTITTFSAAGTYNFIWTNGGCADTAAVIVTANPNAGTDQTVNCAVLPGGSATMTATGTGTWRAEAGNPGTATITASTSPTTTITTFSAPGIYYFIWANGACADTAAVTVTAKPNAGPDQTLNCITLPGGSATMAATGTGTWAPQANNPGTATIANPTSPTTTITGFTAGGSYNFIWTSGACTDTVTINITAKSSAGPDEFVTCYPTNNSATMAATGAGTWTPETGNPGTATITSPTSPTTTITTFSTTGIYNFIWTNGGCTDTASVTITANPNAGPDQTASCVSLPGGSVTMAGTGTGTWTPQANNPGTATITNPTSPTTTITTFSVAGLYNFVWTNGGCTDTAAVLVTPAANAGADQTVSCTLLPGGSATMAATGLGLWTTPAGNPGTATITSQSSPTTTITNFTAGGVYSFVWTNGICSDTATVTVNAIPDAGPDQSLVCFPTYNTVTMAATGTGTWTADPANAGSASITSPTDSITTITRFSGLGTYNFIWTNGNCADTAVVTVTGPPDAGPDQTVSCAVLPGGTATMAASSTGTWIADPNNTGTATITSPTDSITTITNFSTAGSYNFFWSNGTCVDTAVVTVTAKPNAGPFQNVNCAILPGGIATMAATDTGTWTAAVTNPGTAAITDPTSPTTTITTFSTAGIYIFVWSAGGCADSAAVVVTAKPNAGADQTVNCAILPGGTATMAATGSGTWTADPANPGTALITSPTSPITTITTFSSAGTYNFIWSDGTCTDTAAVTVTAKPNAGPDQTVSCIVQPGGTATMAATGTGTWTADPGNLGTATITSPTSATTTITTFSTAGTYNFIWSSGGCADTAVVTVTAKPNAGPDDTVCLNATAILIPVGNGIWGQLLSNPAVTNITTQLGAATTVTGLTVPGTYGYTWTVGGCTDTANVLVNSPPSVNLTVNANVTCDNPTGVINANVTGAAPFTYLWSNATTLDSLTTTTPDVLYTVTVTDANLCTASASDSVANLVFTVSIADSLREVSCYGKDDGRIILYVSPAGSYTYTWDPSETGDSATGLAPGQYTVTVTGANGCSGTGSYTITAPGVDSVSITPLDTAITLGDTIQLNSALTGVYPAVTYSWTPTTGLSCTNCPDPLLIPTAADTVKTAYQLTITYLNGCTVSATDSVQVMPSNLLGIPDAFSPNGDHVNDTFKILATSVKEFRMTIYNRWGGLIFESNDINNGWDGGFQGKQQPEGIYPYFFTLTYLNGKTEYREGSLTILR